jgi:quinohemoprotein ethanol dehydrogenase
MRHGISIRVSLAFALSSLSAAALAASGKSSEQHIRAVTGKVDGAAIQANGKRTKDWLSYGLDYTEARFSRLKQINAGNAKSLGLAWSYDLESSRGVEATPLVVDAIIPVADTPGPRRAGCSPESPGSLPQERHRSGLAPR